MQSEQIRERADYQQFSINDGGISKVGNRMKLKHRALAPVWPDMRGKSVLDVGCDMGYWSFLAAKEGARRVLGVDRGRDVKDIGFVNLVKLNKEKADELELPCEFKIMEAGSQFHNLGQFDVVLLMSLYHHIYAACGGDHEPIWYWLRNMTHGLGTLIWENPVDSEDPVVQMNVPPIFHDDYNEEAIMAAAERYFHILYEGPALHEETRQVWRLKPKNMGSKSFEGTVESGAGGASKAFSWLDGHRIKQIEHVLGERCYPGSLNIRLTEPFNWDRGYYRALIGDVADRSKGLDSPWKMRACRFYNILVDGLRGWAMRFEGESYGPDFLEVIGPERFRDCVQERVRIDLWP